MTDSERELTKCPNCKTRTLTREGQELVCSQCKGRFPAPEPGSPERKPAERRDYLLGRHQFYEKNKDAILADYNKLGGEETAKNWNVGWGALYQVLRRWGISQPSVKAPKERSPQRAMERHSYYEDHKEEIIKDLFTIGRMATRNKWEMASSSLFSLERRWLTADQKARIDKNTHQDNDQLPSLPPFSNSWAPEVQIKWLDIYDKIHAGKLGNEAQQP